MFCQMTKMMDILEDYFWYRKHLYLRLDGSASIADPGRPALGDPQGSWPYNASVWGDGNINSF